MGDPRKPRKAYQTPRHPWRKDQLEEELHLVGEYGYETRENYAAMRPSSHKSEV